MSENEHKISERFRGYLPVVVDIETAGFNAATDAVLEIAAMTIRMDENGIVHTDQSVACHVEPFPGANLEPEALAFNGIDPHHPFRLAKTEEDALREIFSVVRNAVKASGCKRAILVGHNPAFDIAFLNAAVARTKIKRNPFHPFSTFDTVTLGGLAYGQTVLARVAAAAGLEWDSDAAHSAIYDTKQTAELFCIIVNEWTELKALQGKT